MTGNHFWTEFIIFPKEKEKIIKKTKRTIKNINLIIKIKCSNKDKLWIGL